jgi:glutamine amidotransferase
VREPQELVGADKIILPGVGAFGAGMQQLHKQQLVDSLKQAVNRGIPYLGICLGMQFLFERSDEMGNHEGLGLMQGYVTRFPTLSNYKIPHMGWNQLQIQRHTPLLWNVSAESFTYFVHSYYCVPANPEDIVATVDYGISFTAVVQRDNLYGVQFHPEKSQQTGLRILTNFLSL